MPIYQKENPSSSIKIGIWKITETEDELFQMLLKTGFDQSTTSQTKNSQRMKQWLATRLLLASFFKNVTILYNEFGKPYLDNDWKISISHSREFVAIILNERNDCGIDIEKISDKVAKIKHKFLNPLDLIKITSDEHLTLYWGAKEALYKYYGKKEVLFIENLFIKDFSINKTSFLGEIKMPLFQKVIPLEFKKIEDFILVYSL